MNVKFHLEPIDCNTSQGLCFSLSEGKTFVRKAVLFNPKDPLDAIFKLRKLADQLETAIANFPVD